MSLYNMIMGMNPNAEDILRMLSLSMDDIERFRDCFLEKEANEIVILTRTGGGNREHYLNEALTNHPNYLRDYDDDYDETYAWYHFSIPTQEG